MKIVVLLREDLEQLSHGFREMFVILQVLNNCGLGTEAMLLVFDSEREDFEYPHFYRVVFQSSLAL